MEKSETCNSTETGKEGNKSAESVELTDDKRKKIMNPLPKSHI